MPQCSCDGNWAGERAGEMNTGLRRVYSMAHQVAVGGQTIIHKSDQKEIRRQQTQTKAIQIYGIQE